MMANETIVYIISVFNAICCLLFLIYQIPRHTDSTAQIRSGWMSTGEYFLETLKLIGYTGGASIYMILPCYQQCFYTVRKNFNVKFILVTILLISMAFIDGSTQGNFFYIAFAFINLACSFYVCNCVIVPSEEGPDGVIATPMASLPVLNGRVRRASSVTAARRVDV